MTDLKRFFSTELLFDVAGVFLVAVLPLLIFLKHSGYSLVAPEILAVFGLILVFALACGLLMHWVGIPVRILIFAWLAVLVVDVQTDWITTLGLRLLLNSLFFLVLFWLSRRHLSRLLVLVVGLMVLGTAVLPGEESVVKRGEPGPRAGDDPDLPFVLHLVLDEQIGVEGIPAIFDPDRETAGLLRDFYLDNSFAVFGRAYSRYGSTMESLSNMFNFVAVGEPGHWLGGNSSRGVLLENNLWFDMLHEKGYRIHVLESDYMRFFDPGENGENGYGDTRLSYTSASIKPIEEADLTPAQKIPFVLSTFFTRSYILKKAGASYTSLAFSRPGRALSLPAWDLEGNYPGALASMQALEIFTDQLRQVGPGQAFYGHILLPHSPYGFDGDCRMELQPGNWLGCNDKRMAPRTNTPESRALRYPLYLEQMICLQSRLEDMFRILKDKGLWERAVVIIHGDHGSRISLWPPVPSLEDKVVAEDYVDFFSTLFVLKGPGHRQGYYRDLLSLDQLFRGLIQEGIYTSDLVSEGEPWVFLQEMDKRMIEHPLPHFAHGMVLDSAP